jgi:MoxR-like ATPase
MAERQVTTDNQCRRLSDTFFVIATQNPVESHGAYPLPEAQLDRFALRLRIGYPDKSSEMDMLAAQIGSRPRPGETAQVLTPEELKRLQQHIAGVSVAEAVREYLVELARATRDHEAVELGVSPRGLIMWLRISQAHAHLRGRGFVTPDDVQAVALPVLAVRLSGNFDDPGEVVDDIFESVAVPVFD